MLLLGASAAALAAGVHAGMTATAARSLVPGLRLIENNPHAETTDFEALAAALGRFTPRIHLDCPRALLLDVSGCERLFGTLDALAAQVAATVSRLGYTTQPGMADNPTTAYTLALAGDEDISSAPVSALRVEPSDLKHLQALGVATIGALQALPREQLPARFSKQLLLRQRQLRGELREDFPVFRPPQIISEHLEFEGPTDRHDTLLFAMRRLSVALEERLAALGVGALELEISLRASDGEPVRFALSLTRPTHESRSLAALLLGRFESVDTGERWFEGVSARVPSVGPVTRQQRDLFTGGDHGTERALAELVDELTGRLGMDAVVQASLSADPRPERSYSWQPFAHNAPPNTHRPTMRPATFFEPHEVSVDCDAAGRPEHWQNGRRSSRLVAEPVERVHFGWWAGDGAERNYFAVQDEAGARWWLMQRGSGWFIVGAF